MGRAGMAICGAAAAAVIAAAAGQVFTALLAWLVLGRRLSRGQTVAVQAPAHPALSVHTRFLHHRLLIRMADAAAILNFLDLFGRRAAAAHLRQNQASTVVFSGRSEAAAPGMQDRSPGQITMGRELCRLPS